MCRPGERAARVGKRVLSCISLSLSTVCRVSGGRSLASAFHVFVECSRHGYIQVLRSWKRWWVGARNDRRMHTCSDQRGSRLRACDGGYTSSIGALAGERRGPPALPAGHDIPPLHASLCWCWIVVLATVWLAGYCKWADVQFPVKVPDSAK